MAARGPKMADGCTQISINKFFDPSTPSIRKGCDGEKKKWKKKRTVKIAVHYCRTSQPPERRPTGTPTALAKILNIKVHHRSGF